MRIGPYEVLGELGRGGMGVVYRVRGPDGREAALKLLRRADPETFARFERERRLLGSLGEEQGFVGLIDAGTSPEGPWLVMPLVTGGTLRARLESGPLGVEETIALGAALARALGNAHERGIVHRDVKPENVLFTESGRPLVADLGLAKHFDRLAAGGSQSVALTQHGTFTGTAAYMAPEQMGDSKNARPQADVFALGAVLHECLSGRPVFDGRTVIEVLARVSSGTVDPIGRADVPPWLEEIIRRALALDPAARFADGGALARAIGARARRARRGLVRPLAFGVTLAGLVLAGVAIGLGRSPGTRPVDELLRSVERKLAAKDVEGAVADATKAIELDPAFARAWEVRGGARLKKGDLDGAIADHTQAIVLEPGRATAWASRGAARGRKHDWDGALADETKAIDLDPKLASAWMNRAGARGEKGDQEGDMADATRAIELDPKLAMAWMNRSAARGRMHDWDGAIADATKAIELRPELVTAWANRGTARGQTGDLDGEIADESRAIELDPKCAQAWGARGAARMRNGDADGAVVDLEHAIELEPRGALADQCRRNLEAIRQHAR